MPFLIPVLTTTLKTMVTAFFTERVIMATCLEILKYLSRRSSNTVDDKIVAMLEKSIAEKQKSWTRFRDYFTIDTDCDFDGHNYLGSIIAE